MVAMMLREKGVPVVCCCETYKFSERIMLDSIVGNEMGTSLSPLSQLGLTLPAQLPPSASCKASPALPPPPPSPPSPSYTTSQDPRTSPSSSPKRD